MDGSQAESNKAAEDRPLESGAMGGGPKFNRRNAIKTGVAAASVFAATGNVLADRPTGKLAQIRDRAKSCNTPLKQRAASDYRDSLSQYGGRLSNSIRELFDAAQNQEQLHFGVVVVGSGYGASIAAARLSQKLRPDLRVCVLERGREWTPGTLPDTFKDVNKNVTSIMLGPTKGQMNRPLGLYDTQLNDEINILSANGLGGGSLINAGVALRPHWEVFRQDRWPEALRDVEVLGPYYDQVARTLSLSRTPIDLTPKMRSRRLAAERISRDPGFYDRSNLSVMYDHRFLDDQSRNAQGMIQRPCSLCGDCGNGCNVGAKNTLAMNYLPIARHNGTEMYTQVEVNSIEKRSGYYRIHLTYIEEKNDRINRQSLSINSKLVIMGAGSPNSASILLDSQNDDLMMSPKLGHHWSGNGDTVGFVVGLPKGNSIGGYGAYATAQAPVGPTIQTSLNFYSDTELSRRILIQEASVPRAMRTLFGMMLRDSELDHSMIMLGMGHDGANGRLIKKAGRWQIKWDGLKNSAYRKMAIGEFKRLASAHGGQYKQAKVIGDNLATVHPLGGCGMSDRPEMGPVNHLGQVYDFREGGFLDTSTGEAAVHEGLYVVDGSVMPTALGVNPLMTIGAISERIAHHIVINPIHAQLFS